MFRPYRWTLRLGLILALLVAALPAGLAAVAQDGTAIAYGDQVSGEITADAPEVPYTFEGSAGDMITIRMQAVNQGLDSFLALVGPEGGEPLVTDDDTAGNLNSLIGPYTLPADGSYTIIATRFMRLEGTSVGAYTLSLSLAEVTPLTVNETVSVTLDDATPQMFFSFAGQAGQMFGLEARVQPESTSDLRVDVRDPSNGYLNQGYSPAGGVALIDPLVLPVDGEYMIILASQPQGGPDTTNVNISTALTLRPIETMPITFDEAVSGQIDDDTPAMHYVFTASRGDLLRLSGTRDSESQAYEVLLTSPTGVQFYGAVTAYDTPDAFTIDPLVLDQDGQYMILVRRFDDSGQGVAGRTSAYTITLGQTETPLLVAGEEVSGSFDDPNVYEQVFRYEGAAGQAVRITLRSLDDIYAPSLGLQGPSQNQDTAGMEAGMGGSSSFYMDFNSSQPSSMSYEVTLPLDGAYLFRVRNGMYAGPLADGTITNNGTFGLTVTLAE